MHCIHNYYLERIMLSLELCHSAVDRFTSGEIDDSVSVVHTLIEVDCHQNKCYAVIKHCIQ